MVDYFLANIWQFWLLISIICLILELTNGDFYIMCFAIGAAITAILSPLGINFYGQLAVFAAVSMLCIFFVRPFALKYLHGNRKDKPSNADALIGRTGMVSQAIETGGYGRVAVDGDDWKAVSANGEPIEKGCKVTITGRESIIITVEKI